MSVYRPSYRTKSGEKKVQAVWWYTFTFDGVHIQESSKSTTKTAAKEAEKVRRRELEKGFNGIEDQRRDRIRTIQETADTYLKAYQLRNPRSDTFAKYALGHLTRLLGKTRLFAVNDQTIKDYQSARLAEQASPGSINSEVVFLLRLLEERGDAIRAKLKRRNALKLSTANRQISKAFSPVEKAALLDAARKRRSPHIYPALMLALHVGMRDAEIRGLQWSRMDLHQAIATVGDSKTEAGEGRTIPLNSEVLEALVEHSKWYLKKFGETRPEWYVFPFGQPLPTDPTRPITTFKTAWALVRKAAGVQGRWHDNRHTFVTDLAESPDASDETIRDLAGHVSKQMLKHYSHIRMKAKRLAVDSLRVKPAVPEEETKPGPTPIPDGSPKESPKVGLLN